MSALPRRLAVLAVLALGLAGCGTTTSESATSPGPGQVASLADTADKIGSIAQDECATKPAADVFPHCPRFVTEVGNAAVAVRGKAPGHPGAAELEATATRAGDAVSAFVGDGCVANPGQATPAPGTCGPDLRRIQDALAAMRAALGSTPAAG